MMFASAPRNRNRTRASSFAPEPDGEKASTIRVGGYQVFSLKTHAIIFGSIVLAIIAWIMIGNILIIYAHVPPTPTTAARVLFFVIFLALAFSAVPLMVKSFLALQVAIGNGGVGMIRFIIAHQNAIVYGVWACCLLSIVMALPSMVKSGFFTAG
jgi:hypothetical protein